MWGLLRQLRDWLLKPRRLIYLGIALGLSILGHALEGGWLVEPIENLTRTILAALNAIDPFRVTGVFYAQLTGCVLPPNGTIFDVTCPPFRAGALLPGAVIGNLFGAFGQTLVEIQQSGSFAVLFGLISVGLGIFALHWLRDDGGDPGPLDYLLYAFVGPLIGGIIAFFGKALLLLLVGVFSLAFAGFLWIAGTAKLAWSVVAVLRNADELEAHGDTLARFFGRRRT